MPQGPKKVFIQYIADLPKYQLEKPYQVIDTELNPEDGVNYSNLVYEAHETSLKDLRAHQADLQLEADGFQCVRHATQTTPGTSAETVMPYCAEMINLLGQHVNADKMLCYDIGIRTSSNMSGKLEAGHYTPPFRPGVPFPIAHVDHTREGGWDRVTRHLTRSEKDMYLNGGWRIRIYNIWRPLVTTVEHMPLAICDPTTVREQDMWACDQVGPECTAEIYFLRPNPAQCWYWLPRQTNEEVLMFLSWDSHPPDGTLGCCPHTAFEDPSAYGGIPRESVEVRIIVFTRLN